jgi:ankyrin repeat protein
LDALIRARANLNRFPSIGRDERTAYSPLMAAIDRGHMQAMQLLLDRGASVNIENETGWTPLMVAVVKWRAEMLRMLLDHGAAPDVAAVSSVC